MTAADSARPAAGPVEPPGAPAAGPPAAIREGRRRAVRQMGITVAAGIFFWPALFFLILVATNPRPGWWEWLGAAACPALLIAGTVAAARMVIASRRAGLRRESLRQAARRHEPAASGARPRG